MSERSRRMLDDVMDLLGPPTVGHAQRGPAGPEAGRRTTAPPDHTLDEPPPPFLHPPSEGLNSGRRKRRAPRPHNGGGTAEPGRDGTGDPQGADGTRAESLTLDGVIEEFRKHLHIPDASHVKVTLATVVANHLPGDPEWLMLVGGSGVGKNETLQALARMPNTRVASTISPASLLSGSPKRERAQDATGGLLREIGESGFLIFRDFTSILSLAKEELKLVLAALREIYDGEWTRLLGTDGGRRLTWRGKLAVIAGSTTALDQHHAMVSAMGERFILFRVTHSDEEALEVSGTALDGLGDDGKWRDEIAGAVADFLAGLTYPEKPEGLQGPERDRMINLAALAARCRSGVERDPYKREIIDVHAPETPGRLTKALARIFTGLIAIGVDREEAWELIVRTGLDCMPLIRYLALMAVMDANGEPDTTAVATTIRLPSQTTRRALEDLDVHNVLCRKSQGKGLPDLWALSDWTQARLKHLTGYLSRKHGRDTVDDTDAVPRACACACAHAHHPKPKTQVGSFSGKVTPHNPQVPDDAARDEPDAPHLEPPAVEPPPVTGGDAAPPPTSWAPVEEVRAMAAARGWPVLDLGRGAFGGREDEWRRVLGHPTISEHLPEIAAALAALPALRAPAVAPAAPDAGDGCGTLREAVLGRALRMGWPGVAIEGRVVAGEGAWRTHVARALLPSLQLAQAALDALAAELRRAQETRP